MATTKKMKKKLIQEDLDLDLDLEERNSGGHPPAEDRISKLPVEILHHILGFLEMDELLIQTCLVSKKWRNLWKSVSTLNFPNCYATLRLDTTSSSSSSSSSSSTSSVVVVDNIRNNVEKYENFVDHVLRLRDSEASKIQIFKYNMYEFHNPYFNNTGGGGNGGSSLNNFMVSAVVNQGAQEIQITTSAPPRVGNYMINPSIFTSGERLRKFYFSVTGSPLFLIQSPPSMCCATRLTHLVLDRIRLPEGDAVSAHLHLVCPVLESLHMYCCYSKHLKVLDISAPRLDNLSIHNKSWRINAPYFDFLGECRLEIRTPNLTSLDYSGRVYFDCFTENLPRVNRANLDFSKETDLVQKKASFATKLIKGLTSAGFLTLAGIEVFPEDVLKEIFKPLTRLRTLTLTTSYKTSSIHGIVHILNNCNSLELLFLNVDETYILKGDDKHLMLPQCGLFHLKRVCISGLHGHENEIELVKFLLKNSVVLEDIEIDDTAGDFPKRAIEKNLKQFIGEELAVGRSINLRIL